MNRKDFKSAYDKITLSDECRADMKKKLMAAAERKKSDAGLEADELLHTTQEIKLAPRKRSAGKTAAVIGSAAAVIAVFAVGAGIMLNRNIISLPQPVTSAGTQESDESFDSAQPEQAVESTETATTEAEDINTACGTLRFQELIESSAEHSEPQQRFTDSAEAVTELRERWYFRYFSSLGRDEIYDRNHGLEKYEDSDGGDDITDTRPLGDEVPYCDGYYSDTGMTLIYRSEDGTKQANLSISTVENEFIPIALPNGAYLNAYGEPESRFSRESYKNFIDPQYDLSMSVGAYADGEDTYYAAVYRLDTTSPVSYVRIDAKNITREQFIDCIAKNAYQYRIQDHKGLYDETGTKEYTADDFTDDEGFAVKLPPPEKQQTEWGSLNLNTLTYFWTFGDAIPYNGWNVEYWQPLENGEIPYYTLDELPQLTGVDILNRLDIPENFTAETAKLSYRAAYEGISKAGAAGSAQDFGANTEMLPGDDPEEFAEAQKYVVTEIVTDGDTGQEYEEGDHYVTDKTDYFRNKKRTSFCAKLIYEDLEKYLAVSVLDDWRMFGSMAAFGQYPIVESGDFIGGADGNGKLYAGRGEMFGKEIYLGGFKNADGRYVTVEARNIGCRAFAKVLAQLYTGSIDPPAVYSAEQTQCRFESYSYDLGHKPETPVGKLSFSSAALDDYTPRSDFIGLMKKARFCVDKLLFIYQDYKYRVSN